MSDSIDRVFTQALATIPLVSNTKAMSGLKGPIPPIKDRIHLYGLYKQATEGDVDQFMARPTGDTEEDEQGRKKWDAWYSQKGLDKAEAKRRYIPYLLDTMRIYASQTPEARELIADLQELWDQVKHVQVNEPDSGSPPITGLVREFREDHDVPHHSINESQDIVAWHEEVVREVDELISRLTYVKSLIQANSQQPLAKSTLIATRFKLFEQSIWGGLKRFSIDVTLILAIFTLLRWRQVRHSK
ncbi:acyl CoA binding protein-domain-containing protein [Lipomyces japonicus]|uniref:acyl CoA binding protein-domain-containing protein n=1 Tax=Lipomyces japonicus TaxID=56871 RepID=UPI0034CD6F29